MSRRYVLGLDLGTKLGVTEVHLDGGLDAQAIKLDNTLGARTVGVRGIIKRHASAECVGVCIEEPFSRQFLSVKAFFPMLGAAVLACELEGLPWSTAHLAELKLHATCKDKPKKPDMQGWQRRAEADLSEDEVDAAWAGVFALDSDLFN